MTHRPYPGNVSVPRSLCKLSSKAVSIYCFLCKSPACRIACDDSLQSDLGTDTLPGYGRCVTIQSLVCFVQSYRVFFSERSYQFFCRLIALPAWLSVSDDPKASLPELHPGFCPGRDDDDIKNDHGSTFFKRHSSRPVNCRRMLVLFLSQTGE